jgi:hypothetical protein
MSVWQDIRFGVRVLVKGRWFTLAAVSALALGLAGNTAVFTFVNTALLRGLPFEDPHQIVTVGSRDSRSRQRGVSIADFEDGRTARSFEAMTLVTFAALTFSDDSRQQADRYDGFRVYSNIFQVISVTQRTREIGVRMALGAESRQLLWLFGRRVIAHLSLGLALGLAGAVGVGRLLQSLLVQTTSTDPPTLALIAAVLVAVGLTASLWPARRASRIDPVVALRCE